MLRMAHGSTAVPGGDLFSPNHPTTTPFGYLFALQGNADNLLPKSPDTLKYLAELGEVMFDKDQSSVSNSTIPSAYTYFGQFVDHDISRTILPKDENTTDSCELAKEDLEPWSTEFVLSEVKNERSAVLELECIYGANAAIDGQYMSLAKVSESNDPIKLNDPFHDVVRSAPNVDNAAADRVARIPDRRNDSNLIVSQMHVAFLRAHNRLVDETGSFETAQRILRQHYHWVVIHDYLQNQIADPEVFRQVMADSKPLYNPTQGNFYLPLEFSVAAYRFGHSMIRSTYYLNANYPGDFLLYLFVLCVLSNDTKPRPGKGYEQIPQKRVIDWNFFLTGDKKGLNLNLARKIRTKLADPLRTLLDETDNPVPCERRLAVQDLKRGYMLSLPTGQAVAKALGYVELTPKEIQEHSTPDQREILAKAEFLERTPLWFYILCEAMAQGGGNRLGKVGSRIVAEVLIGLVRKSPDSFLKIQGYSPEYKNAFGKFELADFLKLAGVL